MSKQKIVTLGGGSGHYILLKALSGIGNVEITAVVAMSDSGGSSGRLRDEKGTLPPGDALKCLLALSSFDEAREIFQHRFLNEDETQGHSFGNLVLVDLAERLNHDFPRAIRRMGQALNCRGRVLPVTTDKTTLLAELENGEKVFSEANIDQVRYDRTSRIKDVCLVPHRGDLKVYMPVLDAISEADYIIISPGDWLTSLMPVFKVPEVVDAIQRAEAKLIYVMSVMTKFGETDGYTSRSFIDSLVNSVGINPEIVLANDRGVDSEVLEKYKLENAEQVLVDVTEEELDSWLILRDLITEGDLVRHDITKLMNALEEIIDK